MPVEATTTSRVLRPRKVPAAPVTSQILFNRRPDVKDVKRVRKFIHKRVPKPVHHELLTVAKVYASKIEKNERLYLVKFSDGDDLQWMKTKFLKSANALWQIKCYWHQVCRSSSYTD